MDPPLKSMADRLYANSLRLCGISIGTNFKSHNTGAFAKVIGIDIDKRSFTVMIFIGGKPAATHHYKNVASFVDEYTPIYGHF